MEVEKYLKDVQLELIRLGYAGKLLDYEQFKELYNTYSKDINEKMFATIILEIPDYSYKDLKMGRRACILKNYIPTFSAEEIQKIQNELKENGYEGTTIDYIEFKKLYETYGNGIKETSFAQEVLKLSYSSYNKIKNQGKRATILRKLKTIPTEKVKQIQSTLVEQGYVGILINYEQFKELYKTYGNELKEKDFANYVLQLTDNDYNHIKNGGQKAKILKRQATSKNNIIEIQEKLKEEGYEGKNINYEEFQKIYNEYGKRFVERNFAREVLLISDSNFNSIKWTKGRKTKILGFDKKIQIIKEMFLKESRYYAKEELEKICIQNNITVKELFWHILAKHQLRYQKEYEEILIKNGEIWIGATAMNTEYVEKNWDKLIRYANSALKKLKFQYDVDFNRDDDEIIQNAILYTIENRGDIENNYEEYPHIANRMLYNSLKKNMTFSILNIKGVKLKILSSNSTYRIKDDESQKEIQDSIISENNTEQEAISNIETENSNSKNIDIAELCIEELKNQIENGYTKQDAISNTAKKLGLDQEHMLEAMQNYLINNGKVVITENNISWNDNER